MIVFPEIKTMFDLYEKFKREQWNASELDYGSHGETGDITGDYGPTWIDLSKVPSLQGLLPEERSLFIAEHAWLALCTSIQGEDFAARTAASEAEEVPDRDARAALSMQTVDEVRHYEAGMRVLTHRYRDREFVYLRARDQRWKAFLARGYMEKLIGLHIVTEGLAMGRFKNREVHSPDPVIRDMYRRINVDEARHTALGMLYISHSIKEMPETERRQLEEFTFERILEDYRMYTDKMFDPDLCRRVGLDAHPGGTPARPRRHRARRAEPPGHAEDQSPRAAAGPAAPPVPETRILRGLPDPTHRPDAPHVTPRQSPTSR